jgi:hypothetical protein
VITAARKDGKVESVEVLSEAGAPLRMHNPWGEGEVSVSGGKAGSARVHGAVLTLETRSGERLRLVP